MTDEERKILDEQADEVMKDFYDFDEALPDPGDGGGQPLLPAGNYHFQVVKMLRGRQEKGKCAGAKSVELTIKVSDEEQNSATWKELLILHRNTIFKVRQFFLSIGQEVVEGKPFQPDWNAVQGVTGEAEVEINEYVSTKDNQTHQNNRVKRWLEPSENFETF